MQLAMTQTAPAQDRPRYLTTTETAKLCRAHLKRAFPGVKFSVRQSGGGSLNIGWVDGPTAAQVDKVAHNYAGGRFDGMIDMGYNVEHWLLPSGDVVLAHSPGSTGSGGIDEPQTVAKPHPDAVCVSMGARFVFCNRSYKPETKRAALDEVSKQWGVTMPNGVLTCADGTAGSITTDVYVENAREWLATLVHRHLVNKVL